MKQDSWLYSDSFLKRAFAIYGYSMVAGLLIGIPFAIIMMVLTFSFASNMHMAP